MSAERLTLRWVGWYTRGLSERAREERWAEIESDLWEHRADAGPGGRTAFALLSRTVRGVPADLSWRWARRQGRRLPRPQTVAKALGWAFALACYAFAVGNLGFVATAVLGLELYGQDWPADEVTAFSRVCAVLFVLLVVGVGILRRLPRTGAGLVLAAVVATPFVFTWMVPIVAPMGLAIGAAAVVLARRRHRTLAMANRASGHV